MEDFFLSQIITSKEVQAALELAMPSLKAVECKISKGEDYPTHFDIDSNTHILYEIETESDSIPLFTSRLRLYNTPSANCDERQLWLAQMLSSKYQINVLVTFTHPDNPTNPFYNIVFQDGQSYLADDVETEFGCLDTKPVRVIGPYSLPVYNFDSFGKFIGAS
ncbi:hypothetical protein ACFQ48_02805 [Hymenobacter caeli]|uniref:Uncharacterized protein n=1 Tax=Hymenobacter caeli TaxID=2735894 RepID=A0ABX2FKU1_9BACT|nr:hypothetical protein [Hymenobacter caeli]NRT17753.1 hypothetical protein [Hymenobacter caeli]